MKIRRLNLTVNFSKTVRGPNVMKIHSVILALLTDRQVGGQSGRRK